jgi:hypothetical protein
MNSHLELNLKKDECFLQSDFFPSFVPYLGV